MPNCFQLYKKGCSEPSILQAVDDELWLKFFGNVPEPNDHWYCGWYDCIGFRLSMGRTFEDIQKEFSEGNWSTKIKNALNHLQKHYTTRSWYQHK